MTTAIRIIRAPRGPALTCKGWPQGAALRLVMDNLDPGVAERPAGRIVVAAGLGGMGGAQPLAAVMNGAAALIVDVDAERIRRRLATGYLDEAADSLDDALDLVRRWQRERVARSVGVHANAADV